MDREPGRARPTVSVVVSTANRPAFHVARLLARLREQTYRPLEVVLVVGPCPDDMRALADALADVKVVHVSELNLSRSRNTGIRHASGDILAFIDDDAVPSHLWVHELVEAFDREGPTCAGVGGTTLLANAEPAPRVQHRNALVHENGSAAEYCVRLEPSDHNDPAGPLFNRLHGCNMAFRRSAVEAVGGFDETFIFQHEETDLGVRLIRAGHRIVHHPRAFVDHHPASSHFRRDAYDLSYRNVTRSYAFFALKHTRKSFARVTWDSAKLLSSYLGWFAKWTLAREISPIRALKFTGQWLDGFVRGVRLGWRFRRTDGGPSPISGAPAESFRPLTGRGSWSPKPASETGPLRIALLCAELGGASPGGVAVYTEHLAEGLTARGHEVVVFRSGHGAGEAGGRSYKVVGVAPIDDTPHPSAVVQWLREEGEGRPFDVVEAPLWSGEGAGVGAVDLAPLVVRLETPLEVIRQISSLPSTPEMIAAVGAERLALSHATGVIAISRAIASTVEHVYDCRLENPGRLSTVIPIGLPDVDRLSFDPAGPPEREGVTFLYVGRLEARKGVLELGQAFADAARTHPDIRLWIAGADNGESDGHRARTGKTYVETLQELWGPELSGRVRFLGRVSESRKNALMSNCDAFVAPSLYESFGIVFLEAMRQGKPVIGCDVGGIPEIVVDGRTGLLAKPGDPATLADAIRTLADDAGLRLRMGLAGRHRFLAEFSIEAFAGRSEAFYRRAIAQWRGCRFAEERESRVEAA